MTDNLERIQGMTPAQLDLLMALANSERVRLDGAIRRFEGAAQMGDLTAINITRELGGALESLEVLIAMVQKEQSSTEEQ